MVLRLTTKKIALAVMTFTATSLCVSTSYAVPTPTKATAAPAASNAAPKEFVQNFYDWYVISKDNEPDVRGTEIALKQKKAFFDAVLYSKLKEDEEAAAKSPGEIVGLDFDPFVNANGLIYNKYQTGQPIAKGNVYRIPVYGIENGKKTSKPVLEAEVTSANGRCVFSNFHYGKSEYPENENLISVLAVLKKDRQKSSK